MTEAKKPENHILRRLIHLMVGGGDQKTLDNTYDFLVEQVLLEKGSNQSINDICKGIEVIFLIKFKGEEIAKSLERLTKIGNVEEKLNRYTLEKERFGALKKIASETKRQEKEIYSTWIHAIEKKYSDLQQNEKESLVKNLQEYTHRTFLRNGADCAILIDPTLENSSKDHEIFLNRDLKDILKKLPEKLHKIGLIEFPSFLRNISKDKSDFFARLLDGTFIFNIIQTDKELINEIKVHLCNYVFFLDTNIIYNLLGLHGKQNNIRKLIKLAQSFNINFVVSPKTISEMKTSLEMRGNELLCSPNIRRDLAQEAANLSEEDNFITAYWVAYAKTGITREDFIEKFRHVSELLRLEGIQIFPKNYNFSTIKTSEEEIAIRKFAPKKKDRIVEHDAYHHLLIQKMRGEILADKFQKEYWFLSLDSWLFQYSQSIRKNGEKPFLYMPHQLLQILRLFEVQTEDYNTTFIELFSRPQIKTAQNVLPNDLATKILSKISSFADLPKELAERIILDQRFISTISETEDAEKQNTIIEERVSLELTSRVKELEKRTERLEIEKKETISSKKETLQENSNLTTQTETLKNILLVTLLLLLLAINYIVYIIFWEKADFIPRIILLTIDVISFLAICKIRWRISTTINIAASILGIVGYTLIFANSDLPKREVPIQTNTQELVEDKKIDINISPKNTASTSSTTKNIQK